MQQQCTVIIKINSNKKHNNNSENQNKTVVKIIIYGRSCIFRTSRANKPLRFDQQKSLVTDQQNWINQNNRSNKSQQQQIQQ